MDKPIWHIEFEENGPEYTGWLKVKAYSVLPVDDRTIVADGVEIEIDEKWIGIKKEE